MSTIRIPNRPGDEPVCVDCRHFIVTGLARTQCVREECSQPDQIMGRHSVTPEDARNTGACGMSGQFFEPRPPLSWLDRNFSRVLMGIVLSGVAAFFLKRVVFG